MPRVAATAFHTDVRLYTMIMLDPGKLVFHPLAAQSKQIEDIIFLFYQMFLMKSRGRFRHTYIG